MAFGNVIRLVSLEKEVISLTVVDVAVMPVRYLEIDGSGVRLVRLKIAGMLILSLANPISFTIGGTITEDG